MTRPDAPSAASSAIKELILERKLRSGDPMPTETELVDLLGVSRSSVREAVRTLVALDILQVQHGTGTFVGEMSLRPLVEAMVFRGVLTPGDDYATLRDVVQLRIALDLAMAESVVAGATSHDIDDLRALTAQMQERAEQDTEFTEADRAFHLGLASHQDNMLFTQMVGALWDIHTAILPKLGLPTSQDMRDTAKAHVALLDAAVAGDADAFRAAVTRHYEPLLRVLHRGAH